MQFGRVTDIEKPVSRLAQGTVMVTSLDLDYSFALLDGVFELGCNCFDTAHVYGGGDNERTVGKWIRDRGIRDKVVVLGKGAHPKGDVKRVTPEAISQDLNESLSRFGTDYIDLYVLHRDDECVPVGEIVDALNQHKRAGRIHAFGGSNWTHHRIAEANRYAELKGLTPFAVSSPQFGLAWPQKPVWEGCVAIGGPEGKDAREWYRSECSNLLADDQESHVGLALFPWSSLGGGIFSGRFTRDNLDSFTSYLDKLCAECYGHEENFRRLERARQLGHKKGATAAQIALAWLCNQQLNIYPLVGSSTPSEFADNVKAMDIRLLEAEVNWLEYGEPARVG